MHRALLPSLVLLSFVGCHHAPSGATTPPPSARGCPEGMAFIPPGEFEVGDDVQRSYDPVPRRRARVERGFCVERTEVSVEAFRRCVAAGACSPPVAFVPSMGDGRRLCNWDRPDAERHPINCVVHDQARAYCGWAAHPGGPRRLPRETEWEFAARGTAGRVYAWGDALGPPARANLCGSECETFAHSIDMPAIQALPGWTDPFPVTAPVDAFPEGATPEGVLNLTGNVSEWVDDAFEGRQTLHSVLMPNELGHQRYARGGSFHTREVRSTPAMARIHEVPTSNNPWIGFRCARDTP